MALPSSPPLSPELDLPSSPPLDPQDILELPTRPSELSIVGPSRKRQLSDYGSLSSDPLFSEGTSEADEEFGKERRRKRLVKGPWWRLRRTSTKSLRRSMATRERTRGIADSGVFMGSDLSDDSVDSILSSQQRIAKLEVHESSRPSTPPYYPVYRKVPTAEELAEKTINRCLETGHESVDLSDLGLTSITNSTLSPLHQLIRNSHADLTEPPSEDEFSPLTPSIQLFLSGNKLTLLPYELFLLTNLTVLSVRNNDLYEIPPAIGRLQRLKELNVAQNNLQWLPWEMLDVMHCCGDHKRVMVRPNPFIDPLPDFTGPSPLPRPSVTPAEFKEHLSRWGETSGAFFQQMRQWYQEDGVEWTMRHELELRLKLSRLRLNNYLNEASSAGVEIKLCNEQLLFVASSGVRYFNIDGTIVRSLTSPAPVADDERFVAVVDPQSDQPASSSESSTRSLFELTLQKLQANVLTTDLLDQAEMLPDTVASGLRRAAKGIEYGNESCSVCGNHFIIARAEWMEYWFNGYPAQEYLSSESMVPFLRRVCSWKCARPSDLGTFRMQEGNCPHGL